MRAARITGRQGNRTRASARHGARGSKCHIKRAGGSHGDTNIRATIAGNGKIARRRNRSDADREIAVVREGNDLLRAVRRADGLRSECKASHARNQTRQYCNSLASQTDDIGTSGVRGSERD